VDGFHLEIKKIAVSLVSVKNKVIHYT